MASEIVVTDSMNERKSRMFEAADAFAVLPGGLGTLDEFAEAFTGAQLRLHAKPIVLVNIKNYFDPLLALIDHFVAQGFAGAAVKESDPRRTHGRRRHEDFGRAPGGTGQATGQMSQAGAASR